MAPSKPSSRSPTAAVAPASDAPIMTRRRGFIGPHGPGPLGPLTRWYRRTQVRPSGGRGAVRSAGPLHAQERGEVEPLKEGLGHGKAVAAEELQVLLDPIGNQHVLKRLALLEDLLGGVPVAALEVVVELDEVAVQIAVTGQDLLGHDDRSALHEALMDPAHERVTAERTDELQRPAHRHHAGSAQGEL